MFNRPLHPQPLPLPDDIKFLPAPEPLFENMYHSPGENAAIRFCDPNSRDDFFALQTILQTKQVRKWMDDAKALSESEYREWAGAEEDTSFLFAVHDTRITTPEEARKMQGFVYFYSEREERIRVKRLVKRGLMPESTQQRYALEVSFARQALPDGQQTGSGLMSSALRQSCLQIQILLESDQKPSIELFAFVDPENYPAQRTLEASGFEKKGEMKYDWDSYEEDFFYLLNWETLHQKVRDKLLGVLSHHETTNAV